ncbi:MAG: bifunctional folylpolyglutamate synthase/dihydrofolate synthase, partial [Emcibacter sp.]|nr:bifunctional folylpolyglutamate synthase/dihydrofolate synthase [Emcibacter sp.]
ILSALGNPQDNLPPVIHVAGTNGKGSTIAYLLSILEAANLSVHVYTSPHLVHFNERIRLNGKIIDEQALTTLLEHCERVNNAKAITYFEITTAAAMKAFADHPADVLILEVGLGGRLDATNIVERPLSTILTPISQDHEQFLGTDLAVIAMEKASIAKSGVPLVSGPQEKVVQIKIKEIARQKNAALKTNWSSEACDEGFIYKDAYGELKLPRPNLIGPHQISNASLAIAALRHQELITIDETCYASGITSANWPARMQNITDSPYGRLLGPGSELWLDGGHNPAAGQILADFFAAPDERPLYIICGMMANKDAVGFLIPIAGHVAKFYGVKVMGEDSHNAVAITKLARKAGLNAQSAPSVAEALRLIEATGPIRVLICGSLYLAGQILAENDLIPD